MRVDSILVGNQEIKDDMVVNSDTTSGRYIVDKVTGQKVRVANMISDDATLTGIGVDEKRVGGINFILERNGFANEGESYFPTVHNLSFNPYIYKSNEKGVKKTYKSLLFFTFSTDDVQLLEYKTTADVIHTYLNKKTKLSSAMFRFVDRVEVKEGEEDETREGDTLTMYFKSLKNRRFLKLTYSVKDGIEVTNKLDAEELAKCRKKSKEVKSFGIRFHFSGYELPKHIMCTSKEKKMVVDYVCSVCRLKEDDLSVIVVPEETDLNDKTLMRSMYGNELSKTKAVITSPSIELSFASIYVLGLKYVFTTKLEGDVFTIGRILNN